MLDRRQLIAAAAATTALPLIPAAARAAQHQGMGGATLPAAQRFAIGDMTVTALSDGSIRLGPEALQGIDADGFQQLMRDSFNDPDSFVSGINAFLVETGDRTMLIDSGTGGSMNAGAGMMLQNLQAAGTAPEDIDLILATHLHPDHVGGLISDGQAVFPNAELAVSEDERAYWSNSANAAEGSAQFFQLAQSVLTAYSDRLRPFDGETELESGVTAMPLPGHTPGHTGYDLASGDEQLLVWADIVHVAPVQLARPGVTIGFDVNPDQAAETRRRILDRVASDRLRIAGSHISFPGLGHIAPEGDGYRYVAAAYPYG